VIRPDPDSVSPSLVRIEPADTLRAALWIGVAIVLGVLGARLAAAARAGPGRPPSA